MSGLGVAIYIDEMVYSRFAAALRAQGYDAIGCVETTPINRWLSDHDQLVYAAANGRAVLTENVGDFSLLDTHWKMSGKVHAGIIVYAGIASFGELLRRVVIHLDTIARETQYDTLLWLG